MLVLACESDPRWDYVAANTAEMTHWLALCQGSYGARPPDLILEYRGSPKEISVTPE